MASGDERTTLDDAAMNLTLPSAGVDVSGQQQQYSQQSTQNNRPDQQNAFNLAGLINQNGMYAQQQQQPQQSSNDSLNRSHSRSTVDTDLSGGNMTPVSSTPGSTQQAQAQVQQQMQNASAYKPPEPTNDQHSVPQNMGQLGLALQQATGIERNSGSFSAAFNNSADFFSTFSNNPGLISYNSMRPDLIGLPGFRPNGQMGTGFDAKSDLTPGMHMREPKPYKCTHCVKSFANSSYLAQHMRIHLGIKPFGPCTYCGKKFTQLSHLQQHIRTHTGEKPYRCKHPGCEKAFSQLSNLQSHSRCHQADKPFKCNSCYKCFTDENSLLEHIPKHKESKHLKIHICSFCGKSYTQSTYLAKHMTKHSDRQRIGDFNRIRNEFGGEGLDPLNAVQWNGLSTQDQFVM
uniref:Zinc finger protein n=1 Tax=Steinernema glaseri TaxID=37863 RepID=A0A1I7ZLH9_9BILA